MVTNGLNIPGAENKTGLFLAQAKSDTGLATVQMFPCWLRINAPHLLRVHNRRWGRGERQQLHILIQERLLPSACTPPAKIHTAPATVRTAEQKRAEPEIGEQQ